MRQHDLSSPRRTRRRLGAGALIGALSVAALSGCASGSLRGDASTGWLPPAVTESGERVTSLWIGAWIAALAVGALVWGLIGWCVVAYRRTQGRRRACPVQLRYNVPIEILYTVVPVFMVVVLFYYTARDESALARHLHARPTSRSTSSASSGAGTSTTSRTTSTRPARRRSSTGEPGAPGDQSRRCTSRSTSASSSSSPPATSSTRSGCRRSCRRWT